MKKLLIMAIIGLLIFSCIPAYAGRMRAPDTSTILKIGAEYEKKAEENLMKKFLPDSYKIVFPIDLEEINREGNLDEGLIKGVEVETLWKF